MALEIGGPPGGPPSLPFPTGRRGRAVSSFELDGGSGALDWRQGLPTLRGADARLRELRVSDAPSLLTLVSEGEVSRFLAPPPQTAAGFRRFVRWTHGRRLEGRYACFAVVPRGHDAAVGFFQLRCSGPDWSTAEWGFVIGRPHWGTGLFTESAALVLAFAFEQMAVRRLEARAVAVNGRANGALRKIGAVCEGLLRQAVDIDGRRHDASLWSILDTDRQAGQPMPGPARIQ